MPSSTPSAYAVAGGQVERAAGFGMPAREVDGHDFFAVHDAAGWAIGRARAGEGPSLLHVRLNRYFGHFEGDAMTYRGPGEVERLRTERDCLADFRRRVTEAALLDQDVLDGLDREITAAIDRSVGAAKAAARPGEADLLTDVYASY